MIVAAPTPSQTRETLLDRLLQARAESDRVFGIVHKDALYDRPIPERHRILFYIGHLEAFDWNLLHSRLPGLKPFDASRDRLFAFGIDPVDGGLPTDKPSDWPSLETVRGYVDRARRTLDSALNETDFPDWAGEERPFTLLNTAIEHRLMHAETLAYMLHQLPPDRKHRQPQAAVETAAEPQMGSVEIPTGIVTLGLPRADNSRFGWDNEYEAHSVEVPGFVIGRHKITNRQYLEFVNAGGYRDQTLWTPEDWAWRELQGIEHPLFWKPQRNQWMWRGMFDEFPLPLDWPVYTSHAEASAYARWAGGRLPTEAEWNRAAEAAWASSALTRWDPFPVNASPSSPGIFGVEGMMGNGWEWTSSLFAPFPGFRPFPFYAGYSANFFDGMHYVMKGGSTRTDSCMLRPEFRNWFQPHYPYVYAGFRCIC